MSKKSLIIPLIVLLAAAGLLFGIAGHLTGWQGNRPDQVTDDAYLRSDMTPLSMRISGTVRKVLIDLDDEDYRATLNQAKAALAASEASLADNQAAKRIQDAQIDAAKAGIVQAEATINAAKAGVASASPELEISDSFLLLATCWVVCLVVVSFMSKVPTQYRQVTAAPVEAK
jgi:membrane fusion protein, multidrug efflux system